MKTDTGSSPSALFRAETKVITEVSNVQQGGRRGVSSSHALDERHILLYFIREDGGRGLVGFIVTNAPRDRGVRSPNTASAAERVPQVRTARM